jgi:8-oxo-dGTP pyrophosphatase MutT (NUDIX family)
VDAATLIILDRSGREPRFLMGKRHANHRFMPNVFVFPGGRTEPGDAKVSVAAPLDAEETARLALACPKASASRARRLALAAIRETFEETGLVIGEPGAPHPSLAKPWDEFTHTGFVPDLSGLRFVARAITPPRRPKRFDTRFFIADATSIRHEVAGVVTPDSELTELAWLTFAETEAKPLHIITRVILGELAKRLEAEKAGHTTEIPFFFERYGKMQRLNLIG